MNTREVESYGRSCIVLKIVAAYVVTVIIYFESDIDYLRLVLQEFKLFIWLQHTSSMWMYLLLYHRGVLLSWACWKYLNEPDEITFPISSPVKQALGTVLYYFSEK